MQTKISYEKGRILLTGAAADGSPLRLANLELFEGTGCWALTDVRLAPHQVPSEYSAGHSAESFQAVFVPENDRQREIARRLLRRYREDADGSIRWCTFDGIVRGYAHVNGVRPPNSTDFHDCGYFSRREGIAQLREMQNWWAHYSGDPKYAKIDNPNLQLTSSQLQLEVHLRTLAKVGHVPPSADSSGATSVDRTLSTLQDTGSSP